MGAKSNLLTFLREIGVKNADFYKKTGLSNGFLDKGENISSQNIEIIFSKYPNLSISWLVTGEGNMFADGKSSADGRAEAAEPEKNMADKTIELPLIPIEAVAGFNGIDSHGTTIDDCTIYKVPDFDVAGAQYLIKVTGNSMTPNYNSGDVLACKKIVDLAFFQWGRTYVIDSTQGAMVKRIYKCDTDDNLIVCKSDNPNYPPFELPKSEIRSLSIVVGAVHIE